MELLHYDKANVKWSPHRNETEAFGKTFNEWMVPIHNRWNDTPPNMSKHTTQPTEAVYSQRLGALTPQQFQTALARFGLGTFVQAAPVSQGLFGQNVYVQSSQGDYVLRGAPHFPWQFPKERFGATLLHKRTQVPVAYPYMLDPSTEIFGWPYLLMPRLHGRSAADHTLGDAEQLDIARALGQNLAHLHQLTWPFSGEYNLASDTIQPFDEGFARWIVADTRQWLAKARTNGLATTADDAVWTEHVIAQAQSALERAFLPCFVMNDYNPGNVLVERIDGTWHVSGLFDLMEYYFGNGEADLMRLIAIYLERDQQHGVELAHTFASRYLAQNRPRQSFRERYAFFVLRDRLIAWEYGTRPRVNWFPHEPSFRDYAEPFTMSWRLVVSDAVGSG
jgi:hygromycin-B 7''-O-kinase